MGDHIRRMEGAIASLSPVIRGVFFDLDRID
jgi:hypothetical protein